MPTFRCPPANRSAAIHPQPRVRRPEIRSLLRYSGKPALTVDGFQPSLCVGESNAVHGVFSARCETTLKLLGMEIELKILSSVIVDIAAILSIIVQIAHYSLSNSSTGTRPARVSRAFSRLRSIELVMKMTAPSAIITWNPP